MADQDFNQIVVGFTRKRDGQLVTVKLLELFKQVLKADFVNNEITLDGEVCVLDSFRKVNLQPILGLRLNFAGGTGYVLVNGVEYTNDCSILCKADETLPIAVKCNTGSIGSITDEFGVPILHDHGNFTLKMEKDRMVNVLFIS